MTDEPEPRSEAEILRRGGQMVIERLPNEWTGTIRVGDAADGGPDGVLKITAPDGVSATLTIEVKRVIESRDVAMIRERLIRRVHSYAGGLVLSRYLSLPVRRRLAEAGFSYADATGNVWVSLARPGLFLSDRGADRDPWRGPGRSRGTLKGAPAAKVVRALIDVGGSWTVRELVDVARASTGSTYRVIELLRDEELIERDSSGQMRVLDWVRLLRRWSDDYGFVRNSRVTRWIAPRGLAKLLERAAADSRVQYAVTGTIAAAAWAAYAPARAAMIYTVNAAQSAESWDLYPAEAGANVMLAEPEVDVVFERTATVDGVHYAAPAQVAVDLMTGPGRGPAEAEELIDWMMRNETSWRH